MIDKRKVGFFRDSTDLWFSRQAQGAISDWLLGPSLALRTSLIMVVSEGLSRGTGMDARTVRPCTCCSRSSCSKSGSRRTSHVPWLHS